MAGKFALIIGSSSYDDPSLGRLRAPDLDAQGLEEVLRSPTIGQFDEVVTLLNAGSTAVRKAIARFYDRRQRDDLLLLYFSGHGVKDEQGHLYLALRDTELALLAGSAIETSFIATRMDRSFSKRQVLVLDCCHSGAFAAGTKAAQDASVGTAEAFEGTGLGRVVLTATDSAQYAWEGDRIIGDAQSSLFTHFLVDGLRTGAADRNRDGMVTVDELYDYVRDQVVDATPRQTPRKWAYRREGDIVLARNPFARDPALPLAIEDARNSKLSSGRQQAVHDLEKLLRGQDEAARAAALVALKELALDDSRRVANAAIQALKAYEREQQVESLGQLTVDARKPSDDRLALDASGQERQDDRVAPAHERRQGTSSDIFVSYEHHDRNQARALANALSAQGWTVWWDRRIAPGEAFDVVIERELATSRCVIVLWSTRSVRATWVKNEARRAARRAVLVPVLIEAVEPPLEFENLQAADLTTWDEANTDHPEFAAVLDRIQALAPSSERACRLAVDHARRECAAGRVRQAIASLERFQPAGPLVSQALAELRAEAARIDSAQAEAMRREHTAAEAREPESESAIGNGLQEPLDHADQPLPGVGVVVTSRDRGGSPLRSRGVQAAVALLALVAATWMAVFRPVQANQATPPDEAPIASTSGPPEAEPPAPPTASGPAEPAALPSAGREIFVPAKPLVRNETPDVSNASAPATPAPINVDEFRTRAGGQRQAGDHVQALKTVLEGLRLLPNDAGLNSILTSLLGDARSGARRSKQEAIDLEARDRAADEFGRGVQSESEAVRLQQARRVDAAVRAWWTATDRFKAATARARQVADEDAEEQERPDATSARGDEQAQRTQSSGPRPLPDSGIEQNLVNAALRRYEAAYASLNAQAISEVYPAAPVAQLTQEFAGCQSYVVLIKVADYSFLFTNTVWMATVPATVSYEITPKSGKPTRVERSQTFQLMKQGDAWVIRQIR